MLILIAGITGNIGQHAARHGLNNHQIRGLGRTPEKLEPTLKSELESFVISKTYYDVDALDTACKGVDAIICAYSGMPELHLDAQLLLLRAAERAGVKRFLAASWNYDWRVLRFGIDEPVYNAAIAFRRQVEISSSIKPCWILSGMLAEVFFGVGGQDGFSPRDDGVWDCHATNREKSMDVWGSGDEEWNFTTEEDAGKWGVEVVAGDGAEDGGFVSLCSFTASLNEVWRMYEATRGSKVERRMRGSVEDLEAKAAALKDRWGPSQFWEWHRLWFHLFCVKGIWNLSDLQNGKFPAVEPSSLAEFLEAHLEI